MRFKDKVVVVTGASSGIGREIALEFAEEGAKVIAVARRAEKLEELKNEASNYDGEIIPYTGDVSEKEVNDGMIDFAIEKGGRLDILVNNAGIMDEFRPIGEMDVELWDRVMKINLYGPMYAMKKAVEVMNEQGGGNIVNINSLAGIRGTKAGAAYTAAKHAMTGLTENTAFMYRHNNIRVNQIAPGGIDTDVNAEGNISEYGIGRVMSGLEAEGKTGKVADIAKAVLFLADDEVSSFTTGATLTIDGGVVSA